MWGEFCNVYSPNIEDTNEDINYKNQELELNNKKDKPIT